MHLSPRLGLKLTLILCLLPAVPSLGGSGPAPGDVVYQTSFKEAKGLSGWSGEGRLETSPARGRVLAIVREAKEAKSPIFSQASIPVAPYRGCLLLVSTLVKGENVQAGVAEERSTLTSEMIKTQCHALRFEAVVGGEAYRGAIAAGTFDWKQAAVRVFVPWDATQMTISLGLEPGVTGKVSFDDIRVVVRQVNAFPKGKVAMGPWKFPRLRGTMIDPRALTEKDYQVLGGQWKANLVRWCFHGAPNYASAADSPAYDKWLDGEIKRLDTMLPVLRKYGIYAAIAMFGAPGGGTGWEGSALFSNKACQEKLIEVWQKLAKHYKGVEGIFGYDLVNEPIDILGVDNVGWDTVPGDVYNWWELAYVTSRAIREIDAEMPIFMEPSSGGVPYAFYGFKPFNIPNIVYSLHMYMPYQFTHQGVFPCFDKTLRYPGFEWAGQVWDGNRIRSELQHVVDFHQKWGARIYVGEFSAVRWAPGAYAYIKDVIDVFEAQSWDWTYHAFREHPCWSPEHSETKDNPTLGMTERQKLLRMWFGKN